MELPTLGCSALRRGISSPVEGKRGYIFQDGTTIFVFKSLWLGKKASAQIIEDTFLSHKRLLFNWCIECCSPSGNLFEIICVYPK